MIETPEDHATAAARQTLARDIEEQVPVIAAASRRLTEATATALSVANTPGGSLSAGAHGEWRGVASQAFGAASRSLARDLSAVERELAVARTWLLTASHEVAAGV